MKNKFFVVVSLVEGRKVLAVTTSRGLDRYGALPSGRQCGTPESPWFRIDAGKPALFPINTWVQFDNLRLTSLEELAALPMKGALDVKGRVGATR